MVTSQVLQRFLPIINKLQWSINPRLRESPLQEKSIMPIILGDQNIDVSIHKPGSDLDYSNLTPAGSRTTPY